MKKTHIAYALFTLFAKITTAENPFENLLNKIVAENRRFLVYQVNNNHLIIEAKIKPNDPQKIAELSFNFSRPVTADDFNQIKTTDNEIKEIITQLENERRWFGIFGYVYGIITKEHGCFIYVCSDDNYFPKKIFSEQEFIRQRPVSFGEGTRLISEGSQHNDQSYQKIESTLKQWKEKN